MHVKVVKWIRVEEDEEEWKEEEECEKRIIGMAKYRRNGAEFEDVRIFT